MDNIGYVLKGKEGTSFAGSYIGANYVFVSPVRAAIVYGDESHAVHEAWEIESNCPPYEGYKKEDLEAVPVNVHEEGDVPDLSWLWHCAEDDAELTYNNLSQQKPATFGIRLTLRKLEGLGIIQLSDIDRSKTEEDQKTFEKNSLEKG